MDNVKKWGARIALVLIVSLLFSIPLQPWSWMSVVFAFISLCLLAGFFALVIWLISLATAE